MSDVGQKLICELVDDFRGKVKAEIKRHVNAIPIDLIEPQVHSVLGALLARQGTIAIELAQAVSAWNYHSAPLFIRAMVDAHITIAWLMLDPKDRSKKYVEYGLGQSKLHLEHLKSDLTSRGIDHQKDESIQEMEAWLNAQKLMFLLPVELGSWSNISTREMAIEAGLENAYNFSYQPFSGCVHSTWNHISQYNARRSESPLHRHTFVAAMPEFPPDAHQLDTVARWLDETLVLYQKQYDLPEEKHLIKEWLHIALNEMAAKTKSECVEMDL